MNVAITGTDLTNLHPLTSASAGQLAEDSEELNISLLYNFKSHLYKTGKVCPKPWFWGRFFMEYQPKYESYWLAQWWQTSDTEKRVRFMEQLDYLARETGCFRKAYCFLCGMEDKDWHYMSINLYNHGGHGEK